MRYFAIAMGLVPAVGFAQATPQVQAWTKEHFGLQVEFPGRSTASNYLRVAKAGGTYNYEPSGPAMAYYDPGCQPWQGAYAVLDSLPRGVWVRAAVNLWEHFPRATTMVPEDYERFQAAITGRVLYPNLANNLDGLNLLWVMSPGIPMRNVANDGWFDDPKLRDWYIPAAANRPYLKNQIQNFITAVNNFSVDQAKLKYPSSKIPVNVVSRIGFQLSNEVGAAHPGGSTYGSPGSWTGIGQVLQDTLNGINYRPDDNYATNKLAGGTTWTNPLNMPAFSFLTESRGQAFVNYTADWNNPKSIQWPGATVPGLTEVFSYYDEVFGPTNNFGWAAQCTRRSVHFRSPVIHWVRATDGLHVIFADMNADNTFNGRWETATEYAKRWVDELQLLLKGYGRLAMPSPMPIIDLTECYLTYGEMNSQILDTTNYQFSVNGTQKTTDQIRLDAMARGGTRVINGVTYVAPLQPSRLSIFTAIREELYTRSTQGKLPNLGRIYWVNGYTPDPRRETGFGTADPITSYNPWDDFRLTLPEIKALFGN